MAQARCDIHPPRAQKAFERSVVPTGYPNSCILCGHDGCLKPARVWLDEAEARQYLRGHRVFQLPSNGVKFKVE
jgi:hypothetical protein